MGTARKESNKGEPGRWDKEGGGEEQKEGEGWERVTLNSKKESNKGVKKRNQMSGFRRRVTDVVQRAF